MNTSQPTWVALSDVCGEYGVTYETAKNKVRMKTFPVPTFKVGKILAVDRVVHETYFQKLREKGLSQLSLED